MSLVRSIARADVVLTLLGLWMLPCALSGQSTDSPAVFGARDAALMGGAVAGSAALSALDVRIARVFGDTVWRARHPGFQTAARRGSVATETVLMLGGLGVYAVARASGGSADARGTADVALHTTESVAAAALFIQVIRGTLGRARPYVTVVPRGDSVRSRHDADPYDFRFFQGFRSFDYRSWPSMHAMASFAAASALSTEMTMRGTPHRAVIGPLLYAAATVPSLSRLYLDEHWASDIAMGAFLGVYSGQKVVTYSHAHPGNRVDRTLLRVAIRGGSGGPISVVLSPF